MIANIKCLGTVLVATFNAILLLELCECKPDFGIEVLDPNVGDIDNEKLIPAEASSLAQEGDPEASKRGWSNFNSWGKRAWDKNFAAWGKRGWDNFAAWGKRDPSTELSSQTFAQSEPAKRAGWSKFASWGKRADGDALDGDMDKRKWSNFHTWGKRNKEDYQDQLNEDKKWSKFTTWGKRDDIQALGPEKRKWSQFNSWGKRNGDEDLVDKRKWSQFNSWGKRDQPIENQELIQLHPLQTYDGSAVEISPDKRKWSKFASWGKRLRNAKTWAALNTWGKRRWSGLVTWGKRSADITAPSTQPIAQKLLQYFDENGDGTLDISELNTYLETLTSLPSRQDVDKEESVQM